MGALLSNFSAEREIGRSARLAAPALKVAIIGGGASGSLMALALARHRPDTSIVLIEPGQPGRGLAYGTNRPEQRLNVLPSRLSAFSDQADDFADWLVEQEVIDSRETKAFVPREFMGRYIADRLARTSRALRYKQDRVAAIEERSDGVTLLLARGHRIDADIAILATGHTWGPLRPVRAQVPQDAEVSILGTGLSMVDCWLSLREGGHRGTITAVSRHGLSPLGHGDCPAPSPLASTSVPIGSPVSATMQWLRRFAARAPDWRSAIDALRPHTQAIWRAWTVAERGRFLRHARRHWDIHRHRIAPDISASLAAELASGALRIARSRLAPSEGYVFDCRGYFPDWQAIADPLLASLIDNGTVRPDPLGIGLDVTEECALVSRDGLVSTRLFAIGPLTRSAFWEIEAIPDIRSQCEELSLKLEPAARAFQSAS